MKGFFLSLLGILLAIGIVRFSYGLEPNQVQYFVQVILDLPPDIKGEFQIVIDAAQAFTGALDKLGMVTSTGKDLIDIIKCFFESVGAFLNIPFAFIEFLIALIGQLLKSFRAVFNLLFGPAVLPID